MTEDGEKDLAVGLNQWDGVQWNGLENKAENAVAIIENCDKISFFGQYQNNVALTTPNYMAVELVVKKAGAYTITARVNSSQDPLRDNGYYFTYTGVFMTTGTHSIIVPGAGTPLDFTPDGNNGDPVTITFNSKPLLDQAGNECTDKYIKVEDSSKKPFYTMSCVSVKVRGVYKIDVPLNPATNYIEMTLNVDAEALGATYAIETNTVDGISFKGSGILTGTSMNIKLQGQGTPNSLNDKYMTITSNSKKSTATCNATVIMVVPKKRLLAIGAASDYGYNFSRTGTASNKLITTKTNYGDQENSVVKFEGWEITDGGNDPSATNLNSWLLGANPYDVVVVGYSWGMEDADADVFTKYLAKGGVILLYNEVPGGAQRLFRNLFADSSITARHVNSDGALYNFPYTNDEVLNGPFGDIRGMTWGEDASSTVAVKNIPVSQIDVYSDATNWADASPTVKGDVTAFKHRTLNLIYVGDGGFNSNDGGTSDVICPFKLDSNNYPIFKPHFGEGSDALDRDVYNSIFTANAFAWAIHQSQFHGINTKKQ